MPKLSFPLIEILLFATTPYRDLFKYTALEPTRWLKFRLSLRTFSEGSYSTQISNN